MEMEDPSSFALRCLPATCPDRLEFIGLAEALLLLERPTTDTEETDVHTTLFHNALTGNFLIVSRESRNGWLLQWPL